MLTTSLALIATLTLAAPPEAQRTENDGKETLNVLVITGGGYHDFERNTDALLEGLRGKGGMEFTVLHLGSSSPQHAEGATEFDGGDVFAAYDAILAYHQGDLGFTDRAKDALLNYVRSGGGYVGIHSAADSHPGWDEYDTMLGGRFESHPPFGEINVQIDIDEHEITRGLPTEWTLKDEFYHLKNFKDDDKLVLMTGRSPGDADDASPRPVSWEKNYGAGRVFYTILGHGIETHSDGNFHHLIARAVKWSANAPKPDSEGNHILFDGSSKDGWSMAGPGRFDLEDGELVARGGMGMLWYHERRFRDFTLTVEWKTTKLSDNSGVFMRFHQPSNDPWYAVRHGHEVQILDDPRAGAARGTGSIYAFADAPHAREAAKRPGEWNVYEITVKGDTYTVVLNGTKVLEWSSPTERHGREGYIGLQNHDDNSPVRFRNIKVKVLE